MYNTYGYNPYQNNRYMNMPQQSIQQPVQQPIQQPIQPTSMPLTQTNILSGKQIPDIDTSKVVEYPLDGSVSYFPLTDGSAIITKQLQMDGTSKTVVFKPVDERKETERYITLEDMNKAINDLDLSDIDELKEDIKDIRLEIKELKKKKKTKPLSL